MPPSTLIIYLIVDRKWQSKWKRL